MKFIKKMVLFSALIAAILVADFYIANVAHKNIMMSSANFQQRLSNVTLDFDGPEKQGCTIERAYLLNAYQTCFVAWHRESGESIQGFTYVYHRPWPLLQFYGKSSSSRYFKYSEYGIHLKEIKKYGTVNHLHRGRNEK
ncbi:hypothetical protein [Phaeobacter inhibens]|uniref:hypothetical protein n=1 Tax=Phaeobacter inhibens TaxID=221822 RepID=UPI000F4B07DB|nr:hypothetical protein [Phaeobacter inhibens]